MSKPASLPEANCQHNESLGPQSITVNGKAMEGK